MLQILNVSAEAQFKSSTCRGLQLMRFLRKNRTVKNAILR